MVGMTYWLDILPTSMTLADDICAIQAPTDAVVFIEEIEIFNSNVETNDQLELRFFRSATDQSAVGLAITPNPDESGFPAAGTVARDTRGGADAAITISLWHGGFNLLGGYHLKGSYEEPLVVLSPIAGTAGRFNIRLDAAPAGASLIGGRVKIREIGG